MSCAAGEPIVFSYQSANTAGIPEVLTGRSFVFSLYDSSRVSQGYFSSEIVSLTNGQAALWRLDGTISEGLYGKSGLKWEIAERLDNGRDVVARGTITIEESAPGVVDYDAAPTARYVIRIKRMADMSALNSSLFVVDTQYLAAPVVVQPKFTSNPSISPASAIVGATFTSTDGVMDSGGVVLSRRWLLDGTAIGSGTTVVPVITGSLVLENTGTGNVIATSTAVTVLPAPTPTPTPTPTPSATVQAIGTGGRSATGFQTVSNTRYRERCRSIIRATGSPYVEFIMPLWYQDDAGLTQTVKLPDGSTVKCHFDVYNSGTVASAAGDTTALGKVNGSATYTVATGDAAASTGGTMQHLVCRADLTVPLGASVCMTLEIDAPASGWFLPITDSTATGSTSTPGESVYFGGTTSSIGIFGPLTTNGGSAQTTRALRPLAVIGEPTTAVKAVVAIGDSNTAGKGCGRPASDGNTSQAGMAAHGLFLSSQPYSVLGKNGDRASFWSAASASDPRYDVLKWFDVALLNLGTNDLAGASSATDTATSTAAIAAVRALRPKIKSALKAGSKIGQGYILPRISTSSGFTTLAAQTIQTGYANSDAARPAYDNAMIADVGAVSLDFLFNPRALVADTTVTDKWRVDGGTSHYFESDGTHLTAVGAAAAAVAYRDAATPSATPATFFGSTRTWGETTTKTFGGN